MHRRTPTDQSKASTGAGLASELKHPIAERENGILILRRTVFSDFYRTQVRQFVLLLNFVQIVGFAKVVGCRMGMLDLVVTCERGYVKIDTWISLSGYIDMSKLMYGFF